MKLETLDIMTCPDCKSNLEIEEIFKRNEERIVAGIVGCKCCRYPILDGILIYKKPDPSEHMSNTKYMMELLSTGGVDAAIALPLEGKKLDNVLLYFYHLLDSTAIFKRSLDPLLSLIRYLKKKRYKEYFGKNLTFFDLMSLLKPNTWGDYLKHRFSAESFWSIYPFIPLLRRKNDMILDLGCGAGHVAYVVSKNASPKKLICVDRDYTLLQIAKRFFAKDADYVYMDLNNALPFKNGIFSSIVMLDSFHYVGNRARLANDLERILKLNGLLLIPHLHNALAERISRAFALEHSAWESLFSRLKIKSIPESELIEDLMNKNKLDLNKEYSDIELNESNAISMVGTKDLELFNIYDNSYKPLSNGYGNLIINPIYNVKKEEGKITLKRKVPNELFRTEYPLSMEYLPENVDLDDTFANILKGRNLKLSDKMSQDLQKKIEKLMRNFVIIDVPTGYI